MTSRMEEKSSKIVDAYLSFSVEESLMTERQKRELNPLIIRIHSAKCLPTTPVSIEVLEVIQSLGHIHIIAGYFCGKIEQKVLKSTFTFCISNLFFSDSYNCCEIQISTKEPMAT